MMIEIESGQVMHVLYLSTWNKAYTIWLVLSSTYLFLTDDSLQSADKDQQESYAICRETARCRCKIRHVPKFTAASRCPPCNSTAFLFVLVSLMQQANVRKVLGNST